MIDMQTAVEKVIVEQAIVEQAIVEQAIVVPRSKIDSHIFRIPMP
jgi:hypothetical protein